MLDIREILDRIPHRYPFLLVDRVLEMEADRRIICLKNVTFNEPYFQGHFPKRPIMPGVLIVESMAQSAGILVLSSHPEYNGKDVFFLGIDGVRFRKTVEPGDQLRIEVDVLKRRADVWKFNAQCLVDGKVVAEGEILAMVGRRER
jgi:3-hydroxyacyl-[acyl-carrier-protein] dehydratase